MLLAGARICSREREDGPHEGIKSQRRRPAPRDSKPSRRGRAGKTASSHQQQQQRKQRQQPRPAGGAPAVPSKMYQRHKRTTAAAAAAAAAVEGSVRQRERIKQSGPGLEDLSNNLDGGAFGGSSVDLGAGSTIDLSASIASTSDLLETSWDRGWLDAPTATGKRWGGVDESLKTNCGGVDSGETSCDVLPGPRQGKRVGSAAKRSRARKSEKEEGNPDEEEGVSGPGVEDLALSGSAGATGDTGSTFIGGTESRPGLGQSVEKIVGGGGRSVGKNGGSGGGNGSDGHGGGGGGGGEHRPRARRHKTSKQDSSAAKMAVSLGNESQKKKHVPYGATPKDGKKVGALSGRCFTQR